MPTLRPGYWPDRAGTKFFRYRRYYLRMHGTKDFWSASLLDGVPYRGLVTFRGDRGHGGAARVGLK
jgi:hypothetical protein